MKVLLINAVCGIGSTGKICAEIAQKYESEGHTVKIAYGREFDIPDDLKHCSYAIGTPLQVRWNVLYTRLTDRHGLYAHKATNQFIEWVDSYSPDLVWLHNIHDYYINFQILFDWIKKHPKVQVKWTLHDCWSFTGHCSHFIEANCYKWKTECFNCPNKKLYPASWVCDNSKNNYYLKKAAFTGVKNMELIVPSYWMKNLVQQSFLGEYPITVEYNKINPCFKRTPSDLRKKYSLEDKIVILGVASIWTKNKGLYDFLKLSKILDENYKIVLVGKIKEKVALPSNILCIDHVSDAKTLAQYYSMADYYINASKEESYGLTTAEAAACGTTTIVYKGTACEEIAKMYGGFAVEQGIENIASVITA